MEDLDKSMNQLYLTDIHRTLTPYQKNARFSHCMWNIFHVRKYVRPQDKSQHIS